MSNKCRRMQVRAIGMSMKSAHNFHLDTATNYSPGNNCTNTPGSCGCIHAEEALLRHQKPEILYITHSPCLDCAKIIAATKSVRLVVYKTPYRILDGIQYLEENGIMVVEI